MQQMGGGHQHYDTKTSGDFTLYGPLAFSLRSNTDASVVGVAAKTGGMWGGDEDEGASSSFEPASFQEDEQQQRMEDENMTPVRAEEEGDLVAPEVTTAGKKQKQAAQAAAAAVAAEKKEKAAAVEIEQRANKKARKDEAKKKAVELEAHLKEKRGPESEDENEGGQESKLADDELGLTKTGLKKKRKRDAEAKEAAKNGIAGQKFIKGVKSNDIVSYVDFILGAGNAPSNGKLISLNYVGTLPSGEKDSEGDDKVFDKNQNKKTPFRFRLGTGQVIKGLELGIQGMRVGGERTITIPPHLGYGKKDTMGGGIPANSTLVFHVHLLDVGK
jgi:FK506-binding nuclear protein